MSGREIHVGLNLSPTEDLREAVLPLLEEGLVDALEWSVDMGFHGVPAWADALLAHYADAARLLAHGVELSWLTVGQPERRARWMVGLEAQLARYRAVHLVEHLGLMTAGSLVGGTPLPHPRSPVALALGRARLAELRARAGIPVGLENLAIALSRRDVEEQPDFLDALLAPDGILLLDLHNLLCQAENFGLDPHALLARYPLDRVRALHVAGGGHFVPRLGKPLRRDDHERDVPEACFALLDDALARCPALTWVILEHADGMLRTPADLATFRATFRRVHARIAAEVASDAPREATPPSVGAARDDSLVPSDADLAELDRAQTAYLEALDDAPDAEAALALLRGDPRLASWREFVDAIEPRALELVHALVARWGERAPQRWPDPRSAVLEAPSSLRFREWPEVALGAGEVRLAVLACGVCGTDLHLWRGNLETDLPLVLGHETVGRVIELGPGVSSLRIGDVVGVPWAQGSCGTCRRCVAGHARYCEHLRTWLDLGGGHAPSVRAVASACAPIPEGLWPVEAAPLFCAGHTVTSGLVRARVRAGEHVAVVGIGGLGHLAIQVARALGARVTAVTRSASKRRDALALGASEVIVSDEPGEALARTGGADVVVATKTSTGRAGGLALGLAPEGRLVLAGMAFQPLELEVAVLIGRGATVIGANGNSRADLDFLLGLARDGRVRAQVEVHRPASLRTALHRLEDGRVRFRAVIDRDPR